MGLRGHLGTTILAGGVSFLVGALAASVGKFTASIGWFGSIHQVICAGSGICEDKVACRRYRHYFREYLFMGMKGFSYLSRVAETVGVC